uniref:Uncharacterized protein n=1 Tax=Anguilla anguilla TaxID=7936 RepID=A0A0E9PS40_ANGAN
MFSKVRTVTVSKCFAVSAIVRVHSSGVQHRTVYSYTHVLLGPTYNGLSIL